MIFDGLAMLICGIMGKSGGICGGLSGLITEAIAKLFYEVNTFVDMSDPDRLKIDAVRPTILHPDMGMIPGNEVNFTVTLTNALKPDGAFFDGFTGYPVNEDKMRQSSFAYSLSLHEQAITGLKLGQMYDTWRTDTVRQRYMYQPALNQTFPLAAHGTGINVTYGFYLNEGYIVPYEECYTFFGLEVTCKTRSMDGHSSINLSEAAVYDILPATVADFMAWHFVGVAYQPAWADAGQLAFPCWSMPMVMVCAANMLAALTPMMAKPTATATASAISLNTSGAAGPIARTAMAMACRIAMSYGTTPIPTAPTAILMG
jgi:hypothetical protein